MIDNTQTSVIIAEFLSNILIKMGYTKDPSTLLRYPNNKHFVVHYPPHPAHIALISGSTDIDNTQDEFGSAVEVAFDIYVNRNNFVDISYSLSISETLYGTEYLSLADNEFETKFWGLFSKMKNTALDELQRS